MLAIHLLGVPQIVRDGLPLPMPRGRKAWALLAYLACHDGVVTRSHLASLLFGEAEDPLAALRWNLSELRRLLGDPGLHGDALSLALEPEDYVDVRVVVDGTWMEALGVPGLGRELLEGMAFSSSPSFEVWLAGERRHLQAAAESVLREAALSRLAEGEAKAAASLAARLVGLNPLDEDFQALLVRSLAAAGDGVGAARQAASCADLFRRELGRPPGIALESALRTVTDAPVARPVVGRAAIHALIDAGESAIGAGVLDAGLQCLRRAIADADAIDDAVLRTRARIALGGALVHAARGRDEEGAVALHEALLAAKACAPQLAAPACRELAYVEFLRGRYARAQGWLDRALPLAADDRRERARIATLQGAVLSDTGYYAAAVGLFGEAEEMAEQESDTRQLAYALSMRGRALLLCGDLEPAAVALERSVALARHAWMAFLPWPQSLQAELELQRGNVDGAAAAFEQAFALGCHLGDPCWEGIARRGMGCVAIIREEWHDAAGLLLDAIERCARLPDAYLWGRGYALDALCGMAADRRMPQAGAWIEQLHDLSVRAGLREFTARAHLHRVSLGSAASMAAARLLAGEIDNPRLKSLAGLPAGPSMPQPLR